MIFALSMIDSLLALYTKLKGGKCLIYIGREGAGKSAVAAVIGRGSIKGVGYARINMKLAAIITHSSSQ